MSKVSSIIGWICVVLVSAMTVFSGVANMFFMNSAMAIETATRLGVLEIAFALGVTKLVLTVLYVLPRTSTVGFVLLAAYYAGALATNITHQIPFKEYAMLIVVLAVMTLGAYFRNPELLARLKGKPVA